MRPQEERISKLHKRAVRLQRQADWRKIQGLGSMSAFLAVLLTTVLLQAGGLSQSAPGDQFTGSSLLSEEVGGYILAAMVAFFTGAVITAVIFRYRKKKNERK